LLRRLRVDRSGATAIEYAFIIALIALAVISSVGEVGEQNSGLIQNAADSFSAN